jgi:regulator of replication initiation timing
MATEQELFDKIKDVESDIEWARREMKIAKARLIEIENNLIDFKLEKTKLEFELNHILELKEPPEVDLAEQELNRFKAAVPVILERLKDEKLRQ